MYKLPERFNVELRETFKRTMIITIAMIVECPVLFLVAYFLVEYAVVSTNPDFSGENIIKIVFLVVSVIFTLSSIYLKKLALSPKFHEKAKNLIEVLGKISVFTIFMYALGNIPVTLGFVYYILTGNMKIFQLFLILSVIVYVLCLPRFKTWKDLLLFMVRSKPGFAEKTLESMSD